MALGDILDVSCRPLFDFICDINTVQGFFAFLFIGVIINYLFFRLLVKSKFGRFIIGFNFVFTFPLIGYIIFRNSILNFNF